MTRNPAAIAAVVWAALFALPSFYWSLGGDIGSGTIAADVDEALGSAAEPWAIALTGVVKLLGTAFALSYLLPSLPRPISRRVRVIAGVLLAALLAFYGIANFAGHVLMLAGAADVPSALGDTALRWHTFFWDPYWLLGGVLFGLAVRRFASATRADRVIT